MCKRHHSTVPSETGKKYLDKNINFKIKLKKNIKFEFFFCSSLHYFSNNISIYIMNLRHKKSSDKFEERKKIFML